MDVPGLAASARYLQETRDKMGVMVAGRRLFDVGGWGQNGQPWGVPVFVVTHSVPEGWPRADAPVPVTFVTDGVDSAVRQAGAAAGDGWVGVAGPDVAQQCLAAGLLDEIRVNLVPVLLGAGIRYFGRLDAAPLTPQGPEVIEGTGVTHLRYRVPDQSRPRRRPLRCSGHDSRPGPYPPSAAHPVTARN